MIRRGREAPSVSQEFELFEQYLIRLRHGRLQQAHTRALASDCELLELRVCAHEAELCSRILVALKQLAADPASFIQDNLRRPA